MIPVDANAAVLNALNARAADSCSPAKANDVVRAVGNLLDNPVIVRPSVKYAAVSVVVGDDAAGVPFGRVLDNSAYANERGYASTFFGATNNQYLSTYGLGFLPTDDPLGDVNYSGQGPLRSPSSRSGDWSRPRPRSSTRSPSTSPGTARSPRRGP